MNSDNVSTSTAASGFDSDIRELLVELQEISKRSCEECIQSLPTALDRCDVNVVRLWIDLGIEIATGSGATGIRYFKESLPWVIELNDPKVQHRMLTAAIEMMNVDADAETSGAHLALECLRRSSVAAAVLEEADLHTWTSIGMDLGKWNALAAVEYFRESPAILRVLPFDHLKQWVECGVKLVTTNQIGNFDYLLTLEFFRTTPDIFSEIGDTAVRLRVLEYGNEFAEQSPQVAMAFLKQSPNAVAAILHIPDDVPPDEAITLREEGSHRFEQWIHAGRQALEYSAESARAYFSYESRWALVSIEKAMSCVSLRTVQRPLRMLVSGLSGRNIRIESSLAQAQSAAQGATSIPGCPVERPNMDRPPCLQDTMDTISLPPVLSSYPRKSDNARLYRVMAAHKAGHFEFGTHDAQLESVHDLVIELHSRYGQSVSPTSVWEFFALYPSPRLVQDLWMIVEDARVDFRLSTEYPGLQRDMERVVKEVVIQRPLFQTGSLRDMVVEALMRISVNQPVEGIPASCEEIIDDARRLCCIVCDTNATCETSLRVADRLYLLLDVLNAGDPPSREMPQSDPTDSSEEDNASADPEGDNDGLAYQPIANLAYRGIVQDRLSEPANVVEPNTFESVVRHDEDISGEHTAVHYDEWDTTLGDYRSRWCRVIEGMAVNNNDGETFVAQTLVDHHWTVQRLRKYFEGIRPRALHWVKGQTDGEDIDMDAVIDRLTGCRARSSSADRIFMNRETRVRSVSAAFLMDMSGSTSRILDASGKRVIDVEKEALVLLCEALEALGDRYAMYGFSGRSRDDVRFSILKEFDHRYDSASKQRIGGIEPVHQNRDGTAIRHATSKLLRERAKVKLLVLLSDGRPLDDQYERDYALEDTRMALLEAKRLGIHPFCVTIDHEAPAYLTRMCGEVGFVVVDQVERLPDCLPHIYRRLTT